ncbi:putative gamma-glutamylcyclotransferase [Armadillidium nasatum]|uniref:Gamma-glutamylcyclotransferase family protein n=1 Tax=Armadillidium nasatum TaxID=96803 RepID=A0A5N5TEZ3_9CRUS|nr:putative gamma-glutamylcyclotransferase [Armadillidium nasatum]
MTKFHKVFVYGTLKTNEPNYHWLTEKENGHSRLVGNAKTAQKYPLVIASRYNIPYALDKEGVGENIKGEVYEVDDLMLSKLDILEDHPKYYKRKVKEVILEESGEKCEVWIYLLHTFKDSMLNLPFLVSYESKGDHGLPYVMRYLREKPGSEYWSDVKQE